MVNVTVISMHASYGLAVFLFLVAAGWRLFLCPRDQTIPPPLPFGFVSDRIYKWWDLLLVGLIFAFYYLSAIGVAMSEESDKPMEISSELLILNIGLQFFLVGLVTVAVIGRISPIEWLGLNWKDWPRIFLMAFLALLTMWTISVGLYVVRYQELIESLGVKTIQEAVEFLQKTEDINILILMVISVVIVAPLCEEVVFRGYLYPVLKKFAGPWLGWIISALVFSAAHGSLVALIPLFFFGLVMVLLYEWTGTIWAPIAAHALFNGTTVVVQMMVRFGNIPDQVAQ